MSSKKYAVAVICITLLGVVQMISCTHPPEIPTVSFSNDIIPILNASCTINTSCHLGANSTNLQTNFDSDSAYYTITHKGLVSTTNPTSSLLYSEVRSNEMPIAPVPPLSTAQQTLILEWIQQGARNN